MNAQLIGHVFATLQFQEKSLGNIKKLACGQETFVAEILKAIPEQERVLAHMRRTANLLQLETARNDIPSAIRSLRIFFGLNQMVRNDIAAALSKLTQQQAQHTPQSSPWGKPLMLH